MGRSYIICAMFCIWYIKKINYKTTDGKYSLFKKYIDVQIKKRQAWKSTSIELIIPANKANRKQKLVKSRHIRPFHDVFG